MTGSENDANISNINADISGEKKVDVEVSQLAERYTALHNMRDRSMQFTVWILGLGFAMAWLLISKVALAGI